MRHRRAINAPTSKSEGLGGSQRVRRPLAHRALQTHGDDKRAVGGLSKLSSVYWLLTVWPIIDHLTNIFVKGDKWSLHRRRPDVFQLCQTIGAQP